MNPLRWRYLTRLVPGVSRPVEHDADGRRERPRAKLRAGRALPAMVLLAVAYAPLPHPASTASPAPDPGRKVMVIAEENHGYGQIVGARDAPYLNELARAYGSATDFNAGYPVRCPSLAAYILMTSGSTDGICDDKEPRKHRLTGDNIFHQVRVSGRQWRDYAETAPSACSLTSQGRYLVRHVPAAYYLDERVACHRWVLPLGTPRAGALHDDVAAGRLPAFSFVSPDACHDMHGAPSCPAGMIAAGDRWLRAWLPQILAGPDYRTGRLTVIITWDEGTSASNHIPTLVVAPTVRHIRAREPLTHCSLLRFTEDELRVPRLGCAANATSLGPSFGL